MNMEVDTFREVVVVEPVFRCCLSRRHCCHGKHYKAISPQYPINGNHFHLNWIQYPKNGYISVYPKWINVRSDYVALRCGVVRIVMLCHIDWLLILVDFMFFLATDENSIYKMHLFVRKTQLFTRQMQL